MGETPRIAVPEILGGRWMGLLPDGRSVRHAFLGSAASAIPVRNVSEFHRRAEPCDAKPAANS